MKNYELVGFSEFGSRVGETHHRAILSDEDVDLIRQLREDHGLTYMQIAEKFEVSKSTIRDICRYRRRYLLAVTWRRLPVDV